MCIYVIYMYIVYFIMCNNDSSKAWKRQKKKECHRIKDVSNLFRIKKIDDTTMKDVRNLFRLKKKRKKTINPINKKDNKCFQ